MVMLDLSCSGQSRLWLRPARLPLNSLEPPNWPPTPELRWACESMRKLPLSTTLSPSLRPLLTGKKSSEGAPTFDFAGLEDAIVAGEVDDLAHAGIEHGGTRDDEGFAVGAD